MEELNTGEMNVGRWPLRVEGCGSEGDREGAGKENQINKFC